MKYLVDRLGDKNLFGPIKQGINVGLVYALAIGIRESLAKFSLQ